MGLPLNNLLYVEIEEPRSLEANSLIFPFTDDALFQY